ncbi:AsmA-like C-terminal region [Variovorax sp. HW608]|uniref:AsmA-like C-terminal region-containing protein n=1 Tax=Variovorax sp. HW608 TaxID=1034889 RepID=UPI00081FE08D|nr:AsmA-like C-terminal region-containing protein [Variovorax sp. HW608]SCK06501.1 AsmA-like C-terminal region [Variovorax sp. HW608]
MSRTRRWIAASAALLVASVVLMAGLGFWVRGRLPSDEQVASALAARFEKASGIGLRIGAAHWALRPSPVIVVEDVATAQPRPITVHRIVVRPRLASLWRRKVAIDEVEVSAAVLPRASVRAFRGRWEGADTAIALAGGWTLTEVPIERVRLRDVSWIDRREIALAYDVDLHFDPHWRPREGEIRRPGVSPPARLRVEREGNEDRWRTTIELGDGTWNGSMRLESGDDGHLRLTAALEAKNVDLTAFVRSFGRHSAIEGKLTGPTEVDSVGANVGELIRRLHTRTRFTIAPATITGFDLARAVTAPDVARGGQTRLEALTGTLDTQSTEDGILLRYSQLKARSGVLTASGTATVLNRKLDGEAAVDIVDGVVGVPLKIGGTLDAPVLSLTGAALAGAAVGTAVLPGVGTAIGARVGQAMDKLLGPDERAKPAPKAPATGKAPPKR